MHFFHSLIFIVLLLVISFMLWLLLILSMLCMYICRCVRVIELLQACCEHCNYESTHCGSVSSLLRQINKKETKQMHPIWTEIEPLRWGLVWHWFLLLTILKSSKKLMRGNTFSWLLSEICLFMSGNIYIYTIYNEKKA